jgi:O-acetyl-ADP-ribose deacetylase (regulator of RNase III)
MIRFTQGNVLEAGTDALVNTVNTAGVMGKGIALMFKEAFPENFKAYRKACETGEVRVGRMFVTEQRQLLHPRWIINFPTKKHWRQPSRMEWIVKGLEDLKRVIAEREIRSIALPPLGSGNGGLNWKDVRREIEAALSSLSDIDVVVYEPTAKYQNVAKKVGIERLTPPRALIAELVRRYWILGIECTLLEVQKLAYFLERNIESLNLPNTLDLRFGANKFGPYAERLMHLLDRLDGSYLHCEKRLADASPFDAIWFEDTKREKIAAYLTSPDARVYRPALEATTKLIDGFESPLGMELLATVDWLIQNESASPDVESIRAGIQRWPAGGPVAVARKQKLFNDRLIGLALERLRPNAGPDSGGSPNKVE